MAIKVNGTTVIDDSRNLVNIVSGAGASTTAGAVGTYGSLAITAINYQGSYYRGGNAGTTYAASGLFWKGANGDASTSPTLSGTWQFMTYNGVKGGTDGGWGDIMVRIS
tara:strand:+ start:47 stop:373 length:327 start_codon:yes stop_codon:yes gene_type:complete